MAIEPRDLELIQTVLDEYNAYFEDKEKERVGSVLDCLQSFVDKGDIDYELLTYITLYMAGYFHEDMTNVEDWDWTTNSLESISLSTEFYPNFFAEWTKS